MDAIPPIMNSILHSTAQMVAALGTGIAVDYFFTRGLKLAHKYDNDISTSTKPPPDVTQFVMLSLEVVLQLCVNAVALGFVYNWISALAGPVSDPCSGAWFLIGLWASQPAWRRRVDSVVAYLRRELMLADQYGESKIYQWLKPSSEQNQRGKLTGMQAPGTAHRISKNVGVPFG